MRLVAILVAGVVGIISVHLWDVHTMKQQAQAVQLAQRAGDISHVSPDDAVLLINKALELDSRNPAIWYDASGIYAVKAMQTYVPGRRDHFKWLKLNIEAAQRADALSDEWFYTRDHADTLLFSYLYEYTTIDLNDVLDLYRSIPDTGSEAINEHVALRIKGVERMIADKKEFFNENVRYDVAGATHGRMRGAGRTPIVRR